MKKIIVFVSLLTILLQNYVNAQTFSFIRTSPPIVIGSGTDSVIISYGKIINFTNAPISIRLHRDSVNVPFGWLTMICDPGTCYAKNVDSSNAYNYPPGESTVEMHFYPDVHHNAIAYMYVRAHRTSGPVEFYQQTFGATLNLIGIQQISSVVKEFQLKQNYPNPFNPSTKISFSIPASGIVSLRIYDITGKEIEKLLDQFINKGEYLVDFNAEGLSSGVYYYRIETNGNIDVKKMVLLK